MSLQPDIVLFLVGFNDWHFDTFEKFGHPARQYFLTFPDTLLGSTARGFYGRVSSPTPWRITTLVKKPELSARRSLDREQKISWFPETISEQYSANLLGLSDICRANNLICVFLTQPTAYAENATQEVKDTFWITPAWVSYTLTIDSLIHIARLYNRALIDFATEQGHPVCDLAPGLAATTTFFTDDVHYTLVGSARVAELVADCIEPLVARIH